MASKLGTEHLPPRERRQKLGCQGTHLLESEAEPVPLKSSILIELVYATVLIHEIMEIKLCGILHLRVYIVVYRENDDSSEVELL
jgi:hypothetical protein